MAGQMWVWIMIIQSLDWN